MAMSPSEKGGFNLEQAIRAGTPYSRRVILELLKQGEILINGQVAASLTAPITARDRITVSGESISSTPKFAYYKFHKPLHVISSLKDPQNRTDLRSYIARLPQDVFPVGRLDGATTGLLLLTNDGQFAHRILHPTFQLAKTYEVRVDRPMPRGDLDRLNRGFFLEDGPVGFDFVRVKTPVELTVGISEGRNRIVRRAFEFLGYRVVKLHRTAIGEIRLGKLGAGKIEILSPAEIGCIYP